MKAVIALSSGDLPEDQKWVKVKLSEIDASDATNEPSPKKMKTK